MIRQAPFWCRESDCREIPSVPKCVHMKRMALHSLMGFLIVASCPIALCSEGHDFGKWEKEISAYEQMARANPPPKGAVLFTGSSTIRLWKTLAQDFPKHRVINRGFGGSQIVDSVNYAERIVIPYQPRQIILYAGGNDINAGKTPEQVFADFKSFVG